MNCHVCGSKMDETITDLPFKVRDTSIVIVKDMPVLQCQSCREYLLKDSIMQRLENILKAADRSVELEIVKFAA
ncbi:MAG: YgiT-type zinc finger domain-containing protein [Candidatus Schekmanbacteria bacterium RBG_16_38_11]|uniref:YgiT-type zinc finger domain-containing protein n=2 Tax=Candidatus Schekmaniibacteriota TaxID=1817811 RepID=A0A1F7RLK1_9BACT|nr:MAG: YgiT-type zinc finger domain-containing protein [Candidatus Schekmanbacteria bacterium GWA2_38_11]OGL44107.1 MAG: YgiT-type zinc finger domain-containing protein [Candidatus Schekmanbacteria bacterium RBG_16_38_11]